MEMRRRFVVLVGRAVLLLMGSVGIQVQAEAVVEAACDERLRPVEMRLSLAEPDGSIRVAYSMPGEIRTLELSWPGRGAAARMGHVVVESGEAEIDEEGKMHFRDPVRKVELVVSPEPPTQRYGAQYPTAFVVDGRGTAVYVRYLMPKKNEACEAVSLVVQGGPDIQAVVDGSYHRVEKNRVVDDHSGFVLLGRTLKPNTAVQLPVTLPTWLEELIRESNERAHRGLARVLGVGRKPVPVLVDYSVEGAPDGARNGGDAAGEYCSMRLWFRGKEWEEHAGLEERVFLLLAHELAHCYQQGEMWLAWAHEGHARFLESLLAARPDGEYLSGTRAEERLVRDFDVCMNDLRIGDPRIDAYSCGSVAYWLRWLETGRVTMLEKEDVQNPEERRTLAGGFLLRTVDEQEVVEFLRRSGLTVEVEEDVAEGDRTVRDRLVMTFAAARMQHGQHGPVDQRIDRHA